MSFVCEKKDPPPSCQGEGYGNGGREGQQGRRKDRRVLDTG